MRSSTRGRIPVSIAEVWPSVRLASRSSSRVLRSGTIVRAARKRLLSDIMSTTVDLSTKVVKRSTDDPGRHLKVSVGLAARIEWVLEHRKGRVKNRSQWSLSAGLTRVHVSTLLDRLRAKPDAEVELGTLAALADAAAVSRAWFAQGIGGPDDSTVFVEQPYRYDSLRLVVEQNPGRWSGEALAAAKSKALRADSDPGERYWFEQLERFHQALQLGDMPLPRTIPDRGVDPLADLDGDS